MFEGGFQFAHLVVVPDLQCFTCDCFLLFALQLLMQGIPWVPVHSTADQPTHVLSLSAGLFPASVGPCDLGSTRPEKENPLMLVLQTLEGEKRGNSFSLETCGLSPKAPGTPLPQRTKTTTAFSPLGQ